MRCIFLTAYQSGLTVDEAKCTFLARWAILGVQPLLALFSFDKPYRPEGDSSQVRVPRQPMVTLVLTNDFAPFKGDRQRFTSGY